jgi:hypothetical protein
MFSQPGRRLVCTSDIEPTRALTLKNINEGHLQGLVVLAVMSKVLSWPKFPANREFNREISRFWASVRRRAARHAAQFRIFAPP